MMRTAMSPGYNQHATIQNKAMLFTLDFLERAAASVPLTRGTAVHVADIGASHGANSVQPVQTVLAALAARTPPGTTLEVAVYHEDLPSNDFSQLINLLSDPQRSYGTLQRDARQQQQAQEGGQQQGQQGGGGGNGGSGIGGDSGSGGGSVAAFSCVIARSCYERLFPSTSVHITFSFSTLHFLSVRPVENRVSFFPHANPDPAFRAAFTAQALSDLIAFLKLRAAETVTGGAFVASFPIRNADNPKQWGMGVHFLEQVVQERARDGWLQPEEVANMASYAFLRCQQDVMDALHAVERLWTVKEAFARHVADPLPAQYAAGQVTAEAVADTMYRRVSAVIKEGMIKQLSLTRGRDGAEAAVVAMFDEFRARLLAAPHEQDPVCCSYLYLERTPEACA